MVANSLPFFCQQKRRHQEIAAAKVGRLERARAIHDRRRRRRTRTANRRRPTHHQVVGRLPV